MDICVICQLSNHGQRNFGVASCRACSAFFRRSLLDKKKYTCKFGGNCNITKAFRNHCRACRLKKCFASGMCEDDIKTSKNNEAATSSFTSDLEIKNIELLSKMEQNSLGPLLKSPKFLEVSLQYPMTYRLFNGVKSLHNALKLMVSYNDPKINFDKYKHKLIKKNLFDKLAVASVPLMYNMFEEYYDPFRSIDKELKTDFFKSFAMKFDVLSKAYQTAVIFTELHDTRCVSFPGYYGDASEISYFDDEYANSKERQNITKAIANGARALADKFLLREMSEVEFAILSFIIFSNEAQNFPNMKIQEMESQIFEEIYSYYTMKYGEDNAGVKFGQLFSMYNEISEFHYTSHRDLKLSTIFIEDFYDVWIDLEKKVVL